MPAAIMETGATLVSHRFTALTDGPQLLVMGAVHGNEYAGAHGIARVLAALQDNPGLLQRGSLTLLPVANPAAYAARTRYLNVNPNRIFRRQAAPQLYEERLVNRLCDLVDECDILLDIHTYVAPPSIPFTFADRPEDFAFAAALGAPYILTGWADLVGAAQDSNNYAHRAGKTAVTFEAGQGDDPASVDWAEASIWRAMAQLGLIREAPDQGHAAVAEPVFLHTHTRIVKERDGQLEAGLRHLDPVAQDQLLARYADGTPLTATNAGRIIMPKADARIGDEWFYLAG